MKCKYSNDECIHLDTSGMNQLVECKECTVFKNDIQDTNMSFVSNISANTILKTFSIFSTIALIIVLILLALSGNRIKKLQQTEQLYVHVQDTLKIVLNSLNQETATIEVLQSENSALFTKLKSSDATILRLQNTVKIYEKKIGNLNTAIALNNETIFHLNDSINNLIVGYSISPNTPEIKYPIYYRSFTKQWYSGEIIMGLTQLNINIKSRNEYDITIGDERVSLFKKKVYANITNLNPDTETKEMKVYQKQEVKTGIMKPFTIGGAIGLFIGLLIN